MKVIGLDDKKYTLKLKKKIRANSSLLHIEARSLIRELFPFDAIYEEITMPGLINTLYLDFLIWRPRLAFEVQGEQHYKYVRYFHQNKLNFLRAKKHDKEKKQWCIKNNIELVELPYDRRTEWRKIITER